MAKTPEEITSQLFREFELLCEWERSYFLELLSQHGYLPTVGKLKAEIISLKDKLNAQKPFRERFRAMLRRRHKRGQYKRKRNLRIVQLRERDLLNFEEIARVITFEFSAISSDAARQAYNRTVSPRDNLV